MPNEANKPLSAFGFLTVLQDAQHGFFGGYLVVSTWGRPIEFHCTTPVLPNPAQKILYGASLRPYLLGELIGRTLLEKAKTPVSVVLTDQREILHQADIYKSPIVWVSKPTDSESHTESSVCIGDYSLGVSAQFKCSDSDLNELIAPLMNHVDLAEPFQRIHDAIGEAQRVSEPTEEQDDEPSAAA